MSLTSTFTLKAGQMLVATDMMNESVMEGAVVLLFHHGLNGQIGCNIADALPEQHHVHFKTHEFIAAHSNSSDVLWGGPSADGGILGDGLHPHCANTLIMPLADVPRVDRAFMQIVGSQFAVVSNSRDWETVETLDTDCFARSLMVVGYSGWDSGTLEQQFTDGLWTVKSFNAAVVFDTKTEERFERARVLPPAYLL